MCAQRAKEDKVWPAVTARVTEQQDQDLEQRNEGTGQQMWPSGRRRNAVQWTLRWTVEEEW